ncbi:hypothetical protein D3C77_819470 [compost metagenome]
MTVDIAYSYLMEEDVKVRQNTSPTDPAHFKGSYNAKYENSAHGLGASLTYRF